MYVCVYAYTYIYRYVYRRLATMTTRGSSCPMFSFAEYSLFYRSLLQKRPIILRILLIVATQMLMSYRKVMMYVNWE